MRLPSAPSTRMVTDLNYVYFNRVWNAAYNNRRSNFALPKASERINMGLVPVDRTVVGLPTTDAGYGVYRVPVGWFGVAFTFPNEAWVKDTDLMRDQFVSVNVYTAGGRYCPMGSTYFYYMPDTGQVLVAIPTVTLKACTGKLYPDLNATVCEDTTRKTPAVTSLHVVSTLLGSTTTPAIIAAAIQAARTAYPKGTIVSVNGWIYDPVHVPALQNGDVVGIVSDPDIVDYCDITVDDNLMGYNSTTYAGYREVLHIPKSLNPDNVIITHDTLTTMVFDPVTFKGVYGHRLDKDALESITHNDFSMDRANLDAFAVSLGAQVVTVRVYIRLTTDRNHLHDDVNHLKDLYALPDDEIIRQLAGLSQKQIPQWRASHLEASSYLNLLYKFEGFTRDNALPLLTASMGYHDVAAVLSDSQLHYTHDGSSVKVKKPARLFGIDSTALVYHKGVKLPEGKVVCRDLNDSLLEVGFDAGVSIAVGDEISLYLVEKDYRTPILFEPIAAQPSVILDNEDYQLVEVSPYAQPQPVWNGTVTEGYEVHVADTTIYTLTANSDGTYTYQARSSQYGKRFYLIPKYGMRTGVYPIQAKIDEAQPVVFPLLTADHDVGYMPVLGEAMLEVYLNGYRLIESLDYTIVDEKDTDGRVLQRLCTIASQEYLDFSEGASNMVEVVTHGDKRVSRDVGYAVSNTLYRETKPIMYHQQITRTFVRGKLVTHVHEQGGALICDTDVEDGSPFLTETLVSFGARKLLGAFSGNQDLQLQNKIDALFGDVAPTYPELVPITDQYALYSPYLAQITHDVAAGSLILVDELKNAAFLKQFGGYAVLKIADPVVGNNPVIDRRFVTLAAHYVNLGTSDPEQMIRLQRLIDIVLTPAPLSLEEVLL